MRATPTTRLIPVRDACLAEVARDTILTYYLRTYLVDEEMTS
jgi:hypothetical protein